MVLTKETLDSLERLSELEPGGTVVVKADELGELVIGYRVLLNLSAVLDEIIPQAKKN